MARMEVWFKSIYLCSNEPHLKCKGSFKDSQRKCKYYAGNVDNQTGQCKRTGGCYNELVVAIFCTGDGVKGNKKNYNMCYMFNTCYKRRC